MHTYCTENYFGLEVSHGHIVFPMTEVGDQTLL